MKQLWAPWRLEYIQQADEQEGCVFCRALGADDEAGLVVHRGELAYAVLNLYPYAPGHLMVCPYRHIADYTETTVEEAAEIAAMTKRAMTVTRGPESTTPSTAPAAQSTRLSARSVRLSAP